MQIEVLGCSGGVGPGLRTTCLRLDGRALVDAGTGACDLDLDAMAGLTDVFLTHAHLDHVAGLAFIADNRFGRTDVPLVVHALPEVIQTLRAHLFNWSLWPDFSVLPDADRPTLEFSAVRPGLSIRFGDLEVRPFPSQHTVPTVGYAFSGADGCFAFTGDTYGDPAMWAALNALPRLDKLMIEVAYTDEQAEVGRVSGHLTPTRLGVEVAQLRHRPQLLLTHPKPGGERVIQTQCRSALAAWDFRHLQRGDIIIV